MSNFTANSAVAIAASESVAMLVCAETNMPKRESIMLSYTMQTRGFKAAFNSALAAHNKFKGQLGKPMFDLAVLENIAA